MAKQEPVASEDAAAPELPVARWPRFRLWAIALAAAIAAASGTILLPPAIPAAAPFWAPYALDIFRFLVLWYVARVLVRSLFSVAEWVFLALFPVQHKVSSID